MVNRTKIGKIADIALITRIQKHHAKKVARLRATFCQGKTAPTLRIYIYMKIVFVGSISNFFNALYLIIHIVDEITPLNHRNVAKLTIPNLIIIYTYSIITTFAIEHIILEYVKQIVSIIYSTMCATAYPLLNGIVITPIPVRQHYRQNTVPATHIVRPRCLSQGIIYLPWYPLTTIRSPTFTHIR